MNTCATFFVYLLGSWGSNVFAYENIARNKPTWQHYPFSPNKWGSDKAVDGLYNDSFVGGGQCTMSAGLQSRAEWRVDLGEVFSIHHIFIQYSTANSKWVM
ncbi:uncharacterized protein LOC144624417 [Crassostrea virginica]